MHESFLLIPLAFWIEAFLVVWWFYYRERPRKRWPWQTYKMKDAPGYIRTHEFGTRKKRVHDHVILGAFGAISPLIGGLSNRKPPEDE